MNARLHAVTVNTSCRHIFCADCLLERWAIHQGSSDNEENRGECICPLCQAPLPAIIDRGQRTILNIPICEDKQSQRLIQKMSQDISSKMDLYAEELRGIGGEMGKELVNEWNTRGPGAPNYALHAE